ERCERELLPLVPDPGASALAREDARAFNDSLGDVRDAVLEPFRGLVEKGAPSPELGACLLKTVAELAFWRRVLVGLHRGELREAATSRDFLVRYLLS
ncbi:MAG TPA: hypothetical protein VIV59_03520, partial [Anaeromyxobacteraceae bacterium]